MNVAILHPELGIGGAERLILDAASELGARGHRVVLLTAHCDPARAFPEATDGSVDVRVVGRQLPREIAGRLRAPCAIARMTRLGVALRRLGMRPDVVLCDTVAHTVPLLRRIAGVPVVYYCHFPDLLLAPPATGLRRWYRWPIDALEARGVAHADRVLVNSAYTAGRLRGAFPTITVDPTIVYPGVVAFGGEDLLDEPPSGPLTALAVGRFDPAKRWDLALDAFADVRKRVGPAAFARMRLVLAGGFDPTLREAHETRAMLEARIHALGLTEHVELRPSPTDADRRALLTACRVLIHTATDEHFGYAPVEAMAAGRPVVAIAAAGPAETVQDGTTGFLCPPSPAPIGRALTRLLTDHRAAARMGRAGRALATTTFSRAAFGDRLDAVLREVTTLATRSAR